MASKDQYRNQRNTGRFPDVALSDLPVVGYAIGGARGLIPAANGTTVIVSKFGQDGVARGCSVPALARLLFASLRAHNTGATAWTAGQIQIQDTAGNALITFPSSVLGAAPSAASFNTSGVVYTDFYWNGTAPGEGIQAVVTGYAAGTPIQLVGFASSAT